MRILIRRVREMVGKRSKNEEGKECWKEALSDVNKRFYIKYRKAQKKEEILNVLEEWMDFMFEAEMDVDLISGLRTDLMLVHVGERPKWIQDPDNCAKLGIEKERQEQTNPKEPDLKKTKIDDEFANGDGFIPLGPPSQPPQQPSDYGLD